MRPRLSPKASRPSHALSVRAASWWPANSSAQSKFRIHPRLALYAEQLGKEGAFTRIGQRLRRSLQRIVSGVRLVVDTGLHSEGGAASSGSPSRSPGPSMNPLSRPKPPATFPGRQQALAYKLGQPQIPRAARTSAAGAGSKFDIRSFHDEMLMRRRPAARPAGCAHQQLDSGKRPGRESPQPIRAGSCRLSA